MSPEIENHHLLIKAQLLFALCHDSPHKTARLYF
jgi:hypothetical protein